MRNSQHTRTYYCPEYFELLIRSIESQTKHRNIFLILVAIVEFWTFKGRIPKQNEYNNRNKEIWIMKRK